MSGLRDIFRRIATPWAGSSGAPRGAGFSGGSVPVPAEPLLVLGDLHGRADLLERVLERRARLWPETRLVTLGDYVDRGPASAAVLRLLQAETGPLPPAGAADAQGLATKTAPDRTAPDGKAHSGNAHGGNAHGVNMHGGGGESRAGAPPAAGAGAICLAGNHEAMMLGFLDDPEANGPGWLRNGGIEALASFGIGARALGEAGLREDARRESENTPEAAQESTADAGRPETADGRSKAGRPDRGGGPSLPEGGARLLRDRLRAAMGPETEAWLRALPLWWQSGDLAMVHAGADPALPLEAQLRRSLLWGHPDFARRPRMDGIWIAHGHKIQPLAGMAQGRIALDTGAYATGRLSHALIAPGRIELYST